MHAGFINREATQLICTPAGIENISPEESHLGFDIPVLVRESTDSPGGKDAMKNWLGIVKEESAFPVPDDELVKYYEQGLYYPLFCSLGNGHFYQALNCFRLRKESIIKPGDPNVTI